jgi:hypothetical protein
LAEALVGLTVMLFKLGWPAPHPMVAMMQTRRTARRFMSY